MNLRSIINKTIDGVKYVLTQPTMMFKRKDVVEIIAMHIVKEDEVGRPDLIALEHYNDHSKTDIILKWNGISDPFSLSPGEELEIPTDEVPFYKLERPRVFEENKVKNEFVQGKKFSKKDQRRLDALKKKYNKEVLLPPNVIAVGKKNYEFKPDGTVILGAQAQNDEVTQSILDDLTQDLVEGRIEILQEQIENLGGAGSGSGSGSGAGPGTGVTETQLERQLENNAGKGGKSPFTPGPGKADGSGGGAGDGSAPESTGGANDIANDGAPCN